MKKLVVLVEHGEYYHYDEKTGEECVMDKTYTTYTLCREPKFIVRMNGDIYDTYAKPSYAKVRAYKQNCAWFNRLDKDDKCHWYGVQSHTSQYFSVAFSCLAVDPETCEVIRVMVYNTGMNVYVWKIADNLGE